MADSSNGPSERGQEGSTLRENSAPARSDASLELHGTTEETLRLLIQASSALLDSLNLGTVLPTVLNFSRQFVSADAYGIWRSDHKTRQWRIVSAAGLSREYEQKIVQALGTQAVPSEPLLVRDVEQEPLLATRLELYRREGIRSLLVVPLKAGGENLGAITFYSREVHDFGDSDVQLATAMANLAARAIVTADLYEEQKRLRMEAEASEQRSTFLAKASELLAASLEYEATLASVARLAVAHVADWCVVDVLDQERRLQRVAVVHADAAKEELARQLQNRYPPDPHERRGVAKVLRTGEMECVLDINDDQLVAAAQDAEHLRLLRELGLRSYICAPLTARGQRLGAITFVAESNRRYGQEDVALVGELARIAAQAVDNARLFRGAQEASRLRDEFLATLSHELRTPMTAILGWARLLESEGLDSAAQSKAVATIHRNAKVQAQLIDDILDVSRIITGKVRLEVRPTEVSGVVRAAVEVLTPTAEAKGVRLHRVIDPHAGSVLGDPQRLQQVIWNLLSNAIKFTPRGGRITIALQRINSHVEIIVSDTGEGISAEFLPYVFDRFRQADSSRSRSHGGLGLGLAIVRHLVELHGGTVRAESPGAGQGATFTVRLPLVPISYSQARASEPERFHPTAETGEGLPAIPRVLEGLQALIVDDEEDTRGLVSLVLARSGAEVTAAASSRDALRGFQKLKPDVLVVDIGMPEEDGYAFIRKVRAFEAEQRQKRTPAIALTAYARVQDRLQSLQAGYQMHLTKPIEPTELVLAIAGLLGRPSGIE